MKHDPAFVEYQKTSANYWLHNGFTAIEYAALHTGQPVSGTEWLDNILRAQRHERLAGQALAGLLADETLRGHDKRFAASAVAYADALIEALEGGAK